MFNLPHPRGPRFGRWACLAALLLPSPTVHAQALTGFSEPLRSIDLSAAEIGVVASIEVKEGDRVTAGQKLGGLDVTVLEAALRIAELRASSTSAEKSAAARLELAKNRLKKIEELAARNSAGNDELERARLDHVVSEADLLLAVENLNAARLDVDQTKAQIERRLFRSPVDGVVDRIYADIGENVDSRATPVMRIVQTDKLLIILHLPPANAAELRPGAVVEVRAVDGSGGGKARVEYVSGVVDPASGTVRVKLELPNPDGILRSGVRFELLDKQPKVE